MCNKTMLTFNRMMAVGDNADWEGQNAWIFVQYKRNFPSLRPP